MRSTNQDKEGRGWGQIAWCLMVINKDPRLSLLINRRSGNEDVAHLTSKALPWKNSCRDGKVSAVPNRQLVQASVRLKYTRDICLTGKQKATDRYKETLFDRRTDLISSPLRPGVWEKNLHGHHNSWCWWCSRQIPLSAQQGLSRESRSITQTHGWNMAAPMGATNVASILIEHLDETGDRGSWDTVREMDTVKLNVCKRFLIMGNPFSKPI